MNKIVLVRNVWFLMALWILMAFQAIRGSFWAVAIAAALIFTVWYANKEIPPASRWARWTTTLIAPLFVLVALGANVQDVVSELPSCESTTVKQAFRKMLEDGPTSKVENVRVYDLKNIRQCGWKEAQDNAVTERLCMGTMYTNSGELPAAWYLKWVDREKGEWWIEASTCLLIHADKSWKTAK